MEIGSGFAGTLLTGREHNDEFYMDGDRVRTRTNRSGGVQGGISNGETIYFRVAFKPTATIMSEQHTVNASHEDTTLTGRGRHDPCVLAARRPDGRSDGRAGARRPRASSSRAVSGGIIGTTSKTRDLSGVGSGFSRTS